MQVPLVLQTAGLCRQLNIAKMPGQNFGRWILRYGVFLLVLSSITHSGESQPRKPQVAPSGTPCSGAEASENCSTNPQTLWLRHPTHCFLSSREDSQFHTTTWVSCSQTLATQKLCESFITTYHRQISIQLIWQKQINCQQVINIRLDLKKSYIIKRTC